MNKSNEQDTLNTANAQPLALRPREAAQALRISARSLWTITADKSSGIPHVRFGRSVRYPRAALERWLTERMANQKAV